MLSLAFHNIVDWFNGGVQQTVLQVSLFWLWNAHTAIVFFAELWPLSQEKVCCILQVASQSLQKGDDVKWRGETNENTWPRRLWGCTSEVASTLRRRGPGPGQARKMACHRTFCQVEYQLLKPYVSHRMPEIKLKSLWCVMKPVSASSFHKELLCSTRFPTEVRSNYQEMY